MTDRRSEVATRHAQAQRERWARELAKPDDDLLRMRSDERLTYQQLATRLGVSRQAARYRVRAATRRQKVRDSLN